MGGVAWELYHIYCYRQWPELPEVRLKIRQRNATRSNEDKTTKAPAHGKDASNTACSQVFGILELAEEIFLQLKQSDLLCKAQQVCRQWLVTINSTPSIQEHLFMMSISEVKPQLDRTITGDVSIRHTWFEYEDDDLSRPIIENPFLPLLSVVPLPGPMARPKASWRKMLMTQPGIGRVTFAGQSFTIDSGHASSQGVSMHDLQQVMELKHLTASLQIPGWSAWKSHQDYHQLRALKAEMRLGRTKLLELKEWESAEEVPEYEISEEKTGQSFQLRE